MLGRFFWSSLSDRIGRKHTYNVFFLLGAVLYIAIPSIGNMGNIVLFVLCFGIIMSMYGGGFATIPAYLRDLFGTGQVGAIHGRLLLAWSSAAILGPVLVNYIRAYQIETLQLPPAQVYSITMYIMAFLLLIGFVCNILVKPVKKKYFISSENYNLTDEIDLEKEERMVPDEVEKKVDFSIPLAWLFVGIPLIWGISQTLIKSLRFSIKV